MDLKFFKVAKEGLPIIFSLLIIAWVVALLGYFNLSLLLFALNLFNLFFFRDPERDIIIDSNAVISPADGKVIDISEQIEEHYINNKCKKISIFLSIFDCHINRFPVDGKVFGTKHLDGKYKMAFENDASNENERLITYINNQENGIKLVVVQVAGFVARRIISYAKLDSEFAQGERFGLIKYGSRGDIYLPLKSKFDVEVGQKVRAGETVLAWIN